LNSGGGAGGIGYAPTQTVSTQFNNPVDQVMASAGYGAFDI
jgi:hypothetical protein